MKTKTTFIFESNANGNKIQLRVSGSCEQEARKSALDTSSWLGNLKLVRIVGTTTVSAELEAILEKEFNAAAEFDIEEHSTAESISDFLRAEKELDEVLKP